MAKHTPNTPQQAAAQAGVGVFGRIRQAFSRNKSQQTAVKPAALPANAMEQSAGMAKKGAFTATATRADEAVGRAHGMLSRVNQVAIFGGMFAGVLGGMGKLPLIGGAFNKAAGVARRPEEFMENTTVRDMGSMASRSLGRAKDVAAARGDKGAKIAGKLAQAQERVGKAEVGLTERLSGAAHRVANPLGDAVGNRGGKVLETLSTRAQTGAQSQASKAQGILGDMLSLEDGNEKLADVRAALGKAQSALGGGKGIDGSTYADAMKEAQEHLSKVTKAEANDTTLKALRDGLKKAGGAGATASQRESMAQRFANLPESIKAAPEALANANLKNVALKGAVVTGTTLQVTGTARGVGEKVHTLKNLYCDVTGEQKISTRKLLFSKNVPEVVKEARGHILKEYGPRIVLDFANTVATYTFMKNNNMKSMMGSFGLTAIGSLHRAKVQSYGILPLYEALSQQPQIQDVQYAGFIAAASKDAAAAGGVESPLVQALAVDYAKEGVRPADILKEIENGRFDERAMEKVQQNRAALNQPKGQQAGQTTVSAPRDVVGAHTQRLQQENQGNAHAR